ncbi:hypothetical protein PHYSODRAFT_302626 [Phytophthora sojae]|uniref:Uncharacterized protein n=1 Tax=Phytophthora sojae (strain P6497) TaxID=1094619 RepID=G4ZPX2_PHYSP|nr:hypothetical protein PHYSODRAFT_302626 [Phytophthora sojae]EGZ16376.1 hypothetical protein PHYSODRAFT_302626 [Phytophthora sojae]|eukprot:XP_009530125.1 hypothetical protein PHYSODRAFT_302626 [Phytophthora sojae]
MSRNIDWTPRAEGFLLEVTLTLLDSFKRFGMMKGGLAPYRLGAVSMPHSMREHFLCCGCEACKDVAYPTPCAWRGKMQQCCSINVVNAWDVMTHLSPRRHAKRPCLTAPIKEVVRDMAAHNHKPVCIRGTLVRRFRLNKTNILPLQCVQYFVQGYRTKHLGGSDYVDDVRARILAKGF